MDFTRLIAVILLVSFLACDREVSTAKLETIPAASPTGIDGPTPSESPEIAYRLRQTIGLVKATQKSIDLGDATFYDKDGSVWYKFRFADEKQSAPSRFKFEPFRFNSEDGYLVLNAVGKRDGLIEVIVDEESGDTKFIKSTDPGFKLSSWNEYLLDCYAVGFDEPSNSVLSKPDGEIIASQGRLRYIPVEVKGDWIRVNWHDNDDKTNTLNTGWLRWKKDGYLIVYLFETA